MADLIDISSHLDNLIVAFINGRQMRLVTRNELLIRRICTEFTIRTTQRGPRGMPESVEIETYDLQKKPHGVEILCLSGLLHRLIRISKELKVELKVVDVQRSSVVSNAITLPEPLVYDMSLFDRYWGSMRSWQQEAMALMRVARCGRFWIATGGGKSTFMKFFCRIAKDYKILITTSGSGNLVTLHKEFNAFGIDTGLVTGSTKRDTDCRVICASTRSLHHVDPRRFDIVMGDEIHEMAASTLREALWPLRSPRIFGFSANQDQRVDKQDLWIEGLFGPVILKRTYQENKKDGDVCHIKFRGIYTSCNKTIRSKSPQVRQRHLIVQNHDRNSQFARIAKYYLERGHQVLILTKFTEHVLWMKKLLPDAVCAFKSLNETQKGRFSSLGIWREGDYEGSSTPALVEIRRRFANREYNLAIANQVWHVGADFPPLDVLCRMDAESTPKANTQIAGRLSRIFPGKEFGLLVDGKDEFDHTLARKWSSRRRFYLQQGWEEE